MGSKAVRGWSSRTETVGSEAVRECSSRTETVGSEMVREWSSGTETVGRAALKSFLKNKIAKISANMSFHSVQRRMYLLLAYTLFCVTGTFQTGSQYKRRGDGGSRVAEVQP